MKYVSKSWLKRQFDSFAIRISSVFARKEDVNKLKTEVDDIKDNPPNPDLVMKMDLETGNLLYKFEWKSE